MSFTFVKLMPGRKDFYSSWKRFFVHFMIMAWSSHLNFYPWRTKIRVKLSVIINHYLLTVTVHFDTDILDCELFSLNCGFLTADVIVNRTCYETKSYSTFENVFVQVTSSLDLRPQYLTIRFHMSYCSHKYKGKTNTDMNFSKLLWDPIKFVTYWKWNQQ